MNKDAPKEVKEGYQVLNEFYGFSRVNDPDRYGMSSGFREDAYRIVVLQFHLAIESLLRGFVYSALTQSPTRRIFTKKQNVQYIDNLSSRQLIELAGRLHILSKKGYLELRELNAIRNKCAHNWTLHSWTMKDVGKRQKKRSYKLEYNGNNLLRPKCMEEFRVHYGNVYLELWCIYSGVSHKRQYTDRTLKKVSSALD